MKQIVVIMAGGYGERFWPLSRMTKPKQLQCLVSDSQSMLEQTIHRISDIVDKQDIYIITNELLSTQIKESLTVTIPIENVIAEPSKKNTGPCLLYICSIISKKYEEQGYSEQDLTIAILAADHFISDIAQFQRSFQQCCLLASLGEGIITIGIVPTRPETGYGYIRIGEEVSDSMYITKKFEEKPSSEKALSYLLDGNYLWNSGMFFWRLDCFFNELETVSKELGSFVQNFKEATEEKLVHLYSELVDISIDYALMEQARIVFVHKAQFGWDDVGSWTSLLRVKNTDADGNIVTGKTITIDTTNSLVLNYSSDEKITLATLGIDNLIVVSTDDAVLVCNQENVQDVKKVILEIKTKNFTTLL